ncbi:anti-sigma factor RsbA family regulatory protein [Dactylosporangium sp. AC04546]|uniref:anti-sigma factor RsbA family regulatory protein n=1 Tax=Dactylosporangium sp. AC04546 TaxID=2862460 RepID=UPI001EDDA8C2|nr:anti-sigma factor RsbA family regulatory protein [Dactylosporangium sp. AC04546]WVK78676.1 anti-sigma factor RsbA family regulatory protein [Dactylosporangium sp. AC04546]
MRTGAAAGHTGYFHEAIRYDSDEHLLAVVVPFLIGGVAAGEPTIVALGERNAGLVREALPAGCPVTFMSGGEVYARPAGAIRAYRRLLAELAEDNGQIRIVGELPPEALGATWDWWARYESAINHAYDEFPLWSMCAYNERTTAPAVLADVARTHPRTARPDGRHEPNPQYTEPTEFLLERRPPVADPIQAGPPVAELVGPTPAEAREAVRARRLGDLDDLALAVSEVVTNAHMYGRAPVRMRIWAGAGRVVVTVADGGPGPAYPFAGLLPAGGDDASAGFGLWIAHQTCDHVSLYRSAEGFTVRLAQRAP